MKFTDLAKQVRFRTGTDEITFSNEDIALVYNSEIDLYAHLAVNANINEHFLGMVREEAITWREVILPSNVIRIHRIEFSISWEWVIAGLYTLNRMPTLADEEFLSAYMNGRRAGYAVFGRKLWVLSSDEVEHIRIYAQAYPDTIEADIFTTEATLDAPWGGKAGLPRVFHNLMMQRIAIIYKETRDKPIPLSVYEKNIAWDLETAIRTLKIVDTNRVYKMRKKRLDGVYGDDVSTYRDDDNHETILTDGDSVYLTI